MICVQSKDARLVLCWSRVPVSRIQTFVCRRAADVIEIVDQEF
jgi:hypothetical protein